MMQLSMHDAIHKNVQLCMMQLSMHDAIHKNVQVRRLIDLLQIW